MEIQNEDCDFSNSKRDSQVLPRVDMELATTGLVIIRLFMHQSPERLTSFLQLGIAWPSRPSSAE